MNPFMKQVKVSQEFIERRDDCRIGSIYVSGGLSVSRDCLGEIESITGLQPQVWSSMDAVGADADALPEGYAGREYRFSAAIGAGLATLEES